MPKENGFFELSQLGTYKIEKPEDYTYAEDKSYYETIRVRGSKEDPPSFEIPSHLYKFSDTELALYFKDKKHLWRPMGKLMHENIDISDDEIIFVFPVDMFPEVAKIVPFIRKRGSGKLSLEAIVKRDILNAKRHTDKMK